MYKTNDPPTLLLKYSPIPGQLYDIKKTPSIVCTRLHQEIFTEFKNIKNLHDYYIITRIIT